tara:strand:- start:4197 stop:4409 length:213 start_codon:yes stop_codon:yes gene_type:complete
MTNKNPFEIRADVLAMAKDYMDKQVELNTALFTQLMETGKKTIEEYPKMYTMEDLQEKAKEMYSFVSDKK